MSNSESNQQAPRLMQRAFRFIQFDPETEHEFLDYRHSRILKRVPPIGFAGLGIFFLFVTLDMQVLPPTVYHITVQIRLFIVCPLIGLVIWSAKKHWPYRIFNPLYLLAYVLSGLSVVSIIYAAQIYDVFVPYDGLLLTLVFGYFLMGMPFFDAVIGSYLITLSYFAVEYSLGHSSTEMVYNIVFMFTLNLMGTVGSFLQEQSRRKLFYNEKLLQEAHEKDAHEIAAKSRLVATASHDLRQPLHAMNLLVEDLEDSLPEGREQNRIIRLKESIRQLSQMLNSVLDISRLEAGIVKVQIKRFNLSELLQDILEDFHQRTEELGITLVLQHERIEAAFAESDKILLSRILNNLLDNALAHAQASVITVSLEDCEEGFLISVRDNGKGIEEQYKQAIFEEFYQIDGSNKSGMGLGLAIIRQLCQLLNIKFGIDSVPGEGSRFWLKIGSSPSSRLDQRLPGQSDRYQEITKNDPHKNTVDVLKGYQAILIEDDLKILNSMSKLLEKWQMNIVSFESADKAMKSFETLKAGIEEDKTIIISDYQFPSGPNGEELLSRMREKLGPLPGIIITADTSIQLDDIRKKIAAPNVAKLTQLLHKPAQPSRLKLMIMHLLDAEKH